MGPHNNEAMNCESEEDKDTEIVRNEEISASSPSVYRSRAEDKLS